MKLGKSSIALWLLAPAILCLSLVRPPNPRNDRAHSLPDEVGPFNVIEKMEITENVERLLGTRDVAWWTFTDQEQNELYMTIVFHDANWKSLHPPDMCIRGSDFDILEDRAVEIVLDEGAVSIGRILASVSGRPNKRYLSLYGFVGRGFITSSFLGFYWRNALPALIRQGSPGFLLRVETFIGPDGEEAAEARCRALFKELIPQGRALIAR